MQLKNLKYPSPKLMPLDLQVFSPPDSSQLDKKWQSSTLEASRHPLNL